MRPVAPTQTLRRHWHAAAVAPASQCVPSAWPLEKLPLWVISTASFRQYVSRFAFAPQESISCRTLTPDIAAIARMAYFGLSHRRQRSEAEDGSTMKTAAYREMKEA